MLIALYRFVAYYGSLALFGAVGLLFGLRCRLRRAASACSTRERATQRAVQAEFAMFIRWLAFLRIVIVEYRGFDGLPLAGRVIIANHPGLFDAVMLLARVPVGFCIFKPAIRDNPLLGPAAVGAGYLASDRAIALVRSAAAKIAAGASLVVFPEGTRTPADGVVRSFKPGFALIARSAAAPVQLVRISYSSQLLTKERAWWKFPQLPARVYVEAGPLIDSASSPTTDELVQQVERWYRAAPRPGVAVCEEPLPVGNSALTLS